MSEPVMNIEKQPTFVNKVEVYKNKRILNKDIKKAFEYEYELNKALIVKRATTGQVLRNSESVYTFDNVEHFKRFIKKFGFNFVGESDTDVEHIQNNKAHKFIF